MGDGSGFGKKRGNGTTTLYKDHTLNKYSKSDQQKLNRKRVPHSPQALREDLSLLPSACVAMRCSNRCANELTIWTVDTSVL